jgi:TP901 family phage tail tape measure protein
MAGSVFELFAKLSLDTSEFESKLSSARGEMEKGWGGIGTVVSKGAKVIAGAVTAASAATGAFAKAAVDDSIRYETAFTGVTKTVDETATTSYQMLSDAIKKMATETSSSKEVIAGVMEAAGQLGVSADDIVGFTKTMIELGDTTNLSAEEAAVALARFTNITGESTGNVDRLGATIVALGNNFATDEASIVSMATRLAASGTIAGMTSTDILALSTAMSSVGIQAEAGGTAMSTVLTKIGNAVASGSDKVELFASTAGMTAQEFTNAWKTSPVEALSAFIVGLNKMNESGENVNEVLDELNISGIRETNMIKSLALASGVLTDAVDIANTAYSDNLALNAEAEKRYNTTESKINQLKQAYSNLKILIGDELKPVFRDFLAEATEKVMGFTEKLQNGGLQTALEKIKGGFERIKEAISPLTEQFQAFASNEDVASTATNLLKGAFDLFVDGLHAASVILATVIEKVGQFVKWLNSGSAGAEAMKAAIVALVAGFAAFETVNTIIHTVKAAFLALNAVMAANPITLVIAAIGALVAAFVYLWNTNEDFRNFWINLWDNIKEKVSSAIEFIKGYFEVLKAAFAIVKEEIAQKIEALKESWSAFKEHLAQIGEQIKEVWTAVKDAFVSAWESIKQFVTEDVPNAFNTAVEFLKGLPEKALQWGSDLLGGFVDGIKQKWEDLKQAVSDTAQKIKDFLGFSKPKEGPLSDADTYGGDFIKLLVDGMNGESGNLINKAIEIAESVKTNLTNAWETAKEIGSNFLTNIHNGVAEKASTLFEAAATTAQNTRERISTTWENAKELGSNLLANIQNGVSEKASNLVENATKIASTTREGISKTWESAKTIGSNLATLLSNGVSEKASDLVGKAADIAKTTRDGITKTWDGAKTIGSNFLTTIRNGVSEKASDLTKGAADIAKNTRDAVANTWEHAKTIGSNFTAALQNGIGEKLSTVVDSASKIAKGVYDSFSKAWSNAKTLGNNLISQLQGGVSEKANALTESIKKIGDSIGTYFRTFADKAKTLGSNIIQSVRAGIGERIGDIRAQVQELGNSLSSVFRNLADSAGTWGRDLIGNFVAGLQEKLEALKDKAIAIAQQIKDVIGFSEPKEGPLSNFHTYAPDMMELFAKGIKDNAGLIKDAVSDGFDLRGQIMNGFDRGTVVSAGPSRTISGGGNSGDNRSMTVILQLDRTELGRAVYQLNNEETQRVGVKLAGGIA